MKNFLFKLLVSTFGFIVFAILVYSTVNFLLNSKSKENSLFIWGDSQTFQGIDLNILHEKTNLTIYSAATHGAGVYDFLVFTNSVPDSSDVLISISTSALMRKKTRDYNMSGLSLHALLLLLKHNYSFSEIFEITTKNLRPKKLFKNEFNLYKQNDTLNKTIPLSTFENNFKNKPPYLNSKETLFKEGIKQLKLKGCNINFLKLPYHETLTKVVDSSVVKDNINDFFIDIKSHFFSHEKNDTIILIDDKGIMYDYTHLNETGAKKLSTLLSKMINKKNKMHIVLLK